jgi:hypothetical protein
LISVCFLARFHELQPHDKTGFFPWKLYESIIFGIEIDVKEVSGMNLMGKRKYDGL